jgi:hypothetical protein
MAFLLAFGLSHIRAEWTPAEAVSPKATKRSSNGRQGRMRKPDHARFRIAENAAHGWFNSKTREAICIPQSPPSRSHPSGMPNRHPCRNAKSLHNAQVCRPLSRQIYPLNSTKTQL